MEIRDVKWEPIQFYPNPSAKIVAQFAWKAALRLVMDELDKIYDGDFENSDIVKRIKEELGEEE